MIETKLTARNGMCTISTANDHLDGTGTLGTLITGGSNGTFVKSIIIKAQVTTSVGMIRFFVDNGTGVSPSLLFEVNVPIVTRSGRDCSFAKVIPFNYTLKAGDTIKVATAKAEAFNIIAEGLDWSYPTAFIEESAEYVAATSSAQISTANPNMDGSGSVVSVITADSASNGLEVSSVMIKALVNTSPGMVRLYISSGSTPPTNFLFHEVYVAPITQNVRSKSYGAEAIYQGSLAVAPGYQILASTEKGEAFAVTVQGANWSYPLG